MGNICRGNICSDCGFYKQNEKIEQNQYNTFGGNCFRNPPKGNGDFPPVSKISECGEFKKK